MSEVNNENLNEEFEETMDDAAVITVPIDATLSNSGEAADAKAVGDALALKADASQVVNISVNGEAADNQGVILIDGSDIPVSGTDTTKMDAKIAAIDGKTGADIPINGETGAESIASVIASAVDKTADNIAMSATDATTVAQKIAAEGNRITAVEATAAAAVKSVNLFTPDETGNVDLQMVPYADNLLSSGSQSSSGTFLIRATGGDASISNGGARISSIQGNMTHTGYTEESITPTVSGSFTVEVDRDTFVTKADESGTYSFNYTDAWSPDISEWGITISSGTPASSDSISIVYVKEERGTITPATPQTFISTGWNLYNSSMGYARVVNYSEEYGFRVGGTYTAVAFSATVDGDQTMLTVTDRNFSLPSSSTDGYIFVVGADATTEIYMTWGDWTVQANGGVHQDYTQDVVNLAGIMSGIFPDGLFAVGEVRDEINFTNRKTYSRIERLDYTEENLEAAEASGRAYTADEDYIYLVRAYPAETSLAEGLGHYTANEHGIEFFTGTTVAPEVSIVYSNDLKNKLERDVLTISQQTLTDAQKAQVLQNIGAASSGSGFLMENMTSRLWGKKVSIIGDSISTYAGFIKPGYATWYPNTNAPDVKSVNDTWWKKVLDSSSANLEVNASYSGSRVTNTDANKPDFYARTTSAVLGSPDVIIVAMGTNDSSNSVSLGNYDYSTTYTSLSEATFREAYIKGMKSLQNNFPNAKIYSVILYMGGDYSNSIKSICAMLGVEVIDCNGYEKASGSHPNKIGMRHIASSFLYPNRLETYGLQVADTSFPITLEANCAFLIIDITQNANRYGMWIANCSSTAVTAFAIAKGNDVSTSTSGLTFTITHAGSSTARISVIRLYGYNGIK